IVTNVAGSATSAVVRLTVFPPEEFLAEPISQGVGLGGSAFLFASSTNGYLHWQFNGTNLPDPAPSVAFSSSWLDNVQTNQAGNYTAIVSNWDGTMGSSTGTVSVSDGPLNHWQWRNPLPQGN